MKRTWIIAVVIVIVLVTPIVPAGSLGAYNSVSGLLVCSGTSNCMHEIGHKLDDEAGWISSSHEFKMAVQMYLYTSLRVESPNILSFRILDTFGNRDIFYSQGAETYALIFQEADGKQYNMPEIFRRFYNWNRAVELIRKYVR